jgi:CcmD family protein
MTFIRCALVTLFMSAGWVSSALAFQPPTQQNEFVPLEKLPPAEQLPAAPLLVAAYAFVWIALMFYMWTIWRRLSKIDADIHALETRRRGGSAR